MLYLDGRYEEALEALDGVLAIDPEDRVAHYHRMLSLRALGREEEALVAERAYQYYQIDESAQELTRRYRLAHPPRQPRGAQDPRSSVGGGWLGACIA